MSRFVRPWAMSIMLLFRNNTSPGFRSLHTRKKGGTCPVFRISKGKRLPKLKLVLFSKNTSSLSQYQIFSPRSNPARMGVSLALPTAKHPMIRNSPRGEKKTHISSMVAPKKKVTDQLPGFQLENAFVQESWVLSGGNSGWIFRMLVGMLLCNTWYLGTSYALKMGAPPEYGRGRRTVRQQGRWGGACITSSDVKLTAERASFSARLRDTNLRLGQQPVVR